MAFCEIPIHPDGTPIKVTMRVREKRGKGAGKPAKSAARRA